MGTLTSRPGSNRHTGVGEWAANVLGLVMHQGSDETNHDHLTANELQAMLKQQQVEVERLNRELKASEEKAQLATEINEKAEAENKALHSEVKKLQWQKIQMKTSKATKTLEALKPEKVESSANKGNVSAVSAYDTQAG